MPSITEELNEILRIYDNLDLSNKYNRRAAVQYLYDIFQKIILYVAVNYCWVPQEILVNALVGSRWKIIKPSILYVDKEASEWDNLIVTLNSQGSKVRHNENFYPHAQTLVNIREKAPKFGSWIFKVGNRRSQILGQSTLLNLFKSKALLNIGRAEFAFYQYGLELPFLLRDDYVSEGEVHPYLTLQETIDALTWRLQDINRLSEMTNDDFNLFLQLTLLVERLDAKENILLKYSICPKCGSNISQKQIYHGGNEYDPQPYAVTYIDGCEQCDYELNHETINI